MYFSQFWRESTIKVLAGLVSSKPSLLGLWRAAFSLGPHVAFPPYMCMPVVTLHVQVSYSYKGSSQTGLGPNLNCHLILITSSKALSPNAVTF